MDKLIYADLSKTTEINKGFIRTMSALRDRHENEEIRVFMVINMDFRNDFETYLSKKNWEFEELFFIEARLKENPRTKSYLITSVNETIYEVTF